MSMTYTKDQNAADNSCVLRVDGLVVDGAQEALLGAGGGARDNDALLGGHDCKDSNSEGICTGKGSNKQRLM